MANSRNNRHDLLDSCAANQNVSYLIYSVGEIKNILYETSTAKLHIAIFHGIFIVPKNYRTVFDSHCQSHVRRVYICICIHVSTRIVYVYTRIER